MKLEGHRHNRRLVLTQPMYAALLLRIARHRDTPGAPELFVRLVGTWGARPDRKYIAFRPTTNEKQILKHLGGVSSSPTTTHKESRRMAKAKKDEIDELEAELEGLEEVVEDEEEDEDAPEVEEDEESDDEEEDDDTPDLSSMKVAELKALCKARGLKGIDKKNKAALIALIEAAGDDEDEEDEDPYADLDRTALKALLKENGLPNAKKSESDDDLRARLPVPEADEDEEDDEVEEDEEEDDTSPLDGLSRSELKAYNTANDCGVKVMKSMSDDDLRAAIQATLGEEEEDDTDEYEDMDRAALKAAIKGFDKAAKFLKSQSDDDLRVIVRAHAAKKGGKKGPNPKGTQPSQLTRKLPPGRKSAADVADMAGTSALNIRNYLRTDKGKARFPIDPELGRYSFTDKQAKAIVVEYKKGARASK